MTKKRKLTISFSGGETSAFMTYRILQSNEFRSRYDDIDVVFANTGQEHEETLLFVQKCDEYFGFNTTWVEADIVPERGVGPRHKIVDFRTANRDGYPFEQFIKKYGIPNVSWPKCTTMLKERPMESYRRSLGWQPRDYDTAIGIRVDEVDRQSKNAHKNGLIYPLISDFPTTKPQINAWWREQPFRLKLKSWQGNCVWCWKKSFRKHYTNLHENPQWYSFPREMETKYGKVGPEFNGRQNLKPRTFFRGNLSADDLFYDSWTMPFDPPSDSNEFDPDMDVGGGCGESCEVFTDEN